VAVRRPRGGEGEVGQVFATQRRDRRQRVRGERLAPGQHEPQVVQRGEVVPGVAADRDQVGGQARGD
jgi:hypothetical protein